MLLFKGCPRCRGDLYLDRDVYGMFLVCAQCGYHRDMADQMRRQLAAALKADRAA